MKNIFQYSIVLLLGTVMFSGCKKFDNINKDPNSPTSLAAAPSVQLTATQLMIGYTFGGEMFRYTGLFDQQLTYNSASARQFNNFAQYNIPSANFEASWGNVYEAMLNLKDLDSVQRKAGNYAYGGLCRILMAYTLGMSTDLWDKMPYTQGLQGAGNLQPAFDDQQSIYGHVQSLLDSGIADLAKPTGALIPGPDDLVYAGDLSKWTRLAHALKARFYLHLRKVDNSVLAKAQAELSQGLTSSSDDAFFAFGSSPTSANPMAQFIGQRPGEISFIGNGNPPSYADSLLVATSDPRLPFYIDTSEAVDWLGSFYGNNNSPVVIMTYAEQLFIQAEIDFVNGNTAAAATDANNGAIASVQAITGAPAPPGWVTLYASYNASNITLEKIMTQKYLALFTNCEAFTDWRRTGYPAVVPFAGAVSSIPRRFLYSDYEVNLNKNTPSVQLTDRVWWDVP